MTQYKPQEHKTHAALSLPITTLGRKKKVQFSTEVPTSQVHNLQTQHLQLNLRLTCKVRESCVLMK